jgi:hypothetical protein
MLHPTVHRRPSSAQRIAHTVGAALLLSTAAQAQSPNLLNPEVSASAVMLGGYSTREEAPNAAALATDVQLQEVELQVSSNADPYLRLDLSLVGHTHAGQMEVGFENAFISSLAIPNVTLRAGQFLVAFSKANEQHMHAWHFITAPLPLVGVFGSDHLIGTGLSAEYLAPVPFFAELTLQTFKPRWTSHDHGATDVHVDEDDVHAAEEAAPGLELTHLARLKTFFEFTDNTTLELGGSALVSEDEHEDLAVVWNANMTVKWVPASAARYTSLEWLTEYISASPDGQTLDGLYTGLRYQTAQQWWLQSRVAAMHLSDLGDIFRAEALLAFAPSERTAVRLQYAVDRLHDHAEDDGDQGEHAVPETSLAHEVFLQLIVAIGSHPAHAY